MEQGWLYASPGFRSATGTATMDARAREDVGVARLNGIIEHREGTIHVCKVPRIERGGSRRVRRDLLKEVVGQVQVVAAVGLEAWVALEAAGRRPDMFFGAREGVIEAAFHGLDCAIVIVDEEFTDFLKSLEAAGLGYTIHDTVAP
jgi:putative transcriptional regulator